MSIYEEGYGYDSDEEEELGLRKIEEEIDSAFHNYRD